MELPFDSLRTRIFGLYHQGHFAEAFDVAVHAKVATPWHYAWLIFWQACILCRLGKTNEALCCLEQHRATGMWWNPDRLTTDPDLEALWGAPRFEALVEASRIQLTLERSQTRLRLEVLRPESDSGNPTPLLLALHKHASNLSETLPYWQSAIHLGVTVAVPQSSQLLGPGEFEWTDAELAEQEVLGAFRKTQARYAVDSSRVVLAGTSQGADLAVQLALYGHVIPVCGFIAVAGGAGAKTLESLPRDAARRGVRGVLIVGEQDPVKESVIGLHRTLVAAGLTVKLDLVADENHDCPNDFSKRIQGALEFVLDGVM